MENFSGYLKRLLFAIAGLAALVALVNAFIDPYGMFHIANIPGLNEIKSQASQRGAVYKRVAAERVRPNGLVLGNSRAEIGFDPEHPAWPGDARPAFNLALPGTGPDAAFSQLHQALVYSRPRVVILGLDFLDFRIGPQAGVQNSRSPSTWLDFVGEYGSALLSLNALGDSILTLRDQGNPYATRLTDRGFNPMQDYVAIAKQEGYHALFRQRDLENARTYLRGPKTVFLPDGKPASEFDTVRKIIALAKQRGIKLHLLIYPYHVHSLILFERSGLWPAFEAWKTELVKMITVSDTAVLWDFSGPSSYSLEPVPPAGNLRQAMHWYWEAGHFKKSLGDILLEQMFNHPADGSRPNKVGIRLTADNLAITLAAQRAALAVYEQMNNRDVEELDAIVSSINNKISTQGQQ